MFSIGNPDCNSATWSGYDWSCCTVDKPCGIGEGDCDYNNECTGDLVCGHNSYCGSEFPSGSDCCVLGNLMPIFPHNIY